MRYKGHYEIIGKGPPVLCFSGFGCSNYLFKPLADALKQRYKFILPDNRGMGKSPCVADPYAIRDLAVDGLDLMDDLGIESYHVMGISMGGFIAESLYFTRPESVMKMALLCTMGPSPDFAPIVNMTARQLKGLYQMPLEQRARISVKMTTHPAFEAENPECYESVVQMFVHNPADFAQSMYQFDAIQRFLAEPLPLNEIKVPVLVLCGADDRTIPPENSVILAQKIERGNVIILDASDHLFFLEKQDETARLVEEFLK
jgi:pimeloyl-ACP methyl ester carboxylesterase